MVAPIEYLTAFNAPETTFSTQPGESGVPNQPLLVQFAFSGTAVYVVCALARTKTLPIGNSDMSFFINGTLMGNFSKPPPGTPGYDYNVTVFSAPSLPPGHHDFTIQNGHVNGRASLMLLDAIIYTFDDSSQDSKSSSPTPVGAIAGGIIGGLAFLITLVLGFLWWRKRNSERDAEQNICQPFVTTPPARSSSRHAQSASLTYPMMAPTGTLSAFNVSGGGYADEPPAYELGDVESSSRSGGRMNNSAPLKRDVKRR